MKALSFSRSSMAAVTTWTSRPDASTAAIPSGAASTRDGGDGTGAPLDEQPAGVQERAAGGEHRVDDEHRPPRQVGRDLEHVGLRFEGGLVAGDADEGRVGVGQELEDGVHHPEPGPQDRHDDRPRRDPPGRRRPDRRADLGVLGRQVAARLVDEHRGEAVHRLAEGGPVGRLVAEAGEELGGEGMVDHGRLHGGMMAGHGPRRAGCADRPHAPAARGDRRPTSSPCARRPPSSAWPRCACRPPGCRCSTAPPSPPASPSRPCAGSPPAPTARRSRRPRRPPPPTPAHRRSTS